MSHSFVLEFRDCEIELNLKKFQLVFMTFFRDTPESRVINIELIEIGFFM